MRLLFVCMGNICRSPTAEAVMEHLAQEAGLADRIEVDSAGTGAWHVGDRADSRSRAEAQRRGIVVRSIARQVERADFARFDLLVAMDRTNRRDLVALAPDDAGRAKVVLLREFDPGAVASGDLDVPDPYYGGGDGFADVFEIVERGCRGLLDHVRVA